MKVIKRLIRRKRFYFSIAIFAFLLYAYDFLELRIADQTFMQQLKDNPFGLSAHIDYYNFEGKKVRYLEIGKDAQPLILFIHGAPSSSAFWRNLLKDSILLSNAKLAAVDRLGYGYSGLGKAETSVEKQAAAIGNILKEKRKEHTHIIIHGSSYGGTVAARLAMDFPDLVDGLLLQSASLAPGEEKTYWITYPTSHWALNWMIPASLHVANYEKLAHKEELELMQPLWDRIRSNTIIMHGTADGLIYPENAHYASRNLVNANYLETLFFEGNGHDLLWTQTESLIQSLIKLVHLPKFSITNTESNTDSSLPQDASYTLE